MQNLGISFYPEQAGLETVRRFIAHVSQNRRAGALYRGHAQKEWQPIPSAFRPMANGILTKDQLNRWKDMASRFSSMQDDLHALVLAQHYGIATPLLDWTANPLTALFFACQQTASTTIAGSVLQGDRVQFDFIRYTATVDLSRDNREKPILFNSSSMNVRSVAQDSLMSLHVLNEIPLQLETIFEVPADEKYTTLTALRMFGFSPERVYADIGIAAQEMAKELSIEAFLGPSFRKSQ